MGKPDDAFVHFEDALAFCRCGHGPEYAWSAFDAADARLQRNGPGDRTKAMPLLDEAHSISRELGMRPLIERVESCRGASKA
jgi:hypothetical protein